MKHLIQIIVFSTLITGSILTIHSLFRYESIIQESNLAEQTATITEHSSVMQPQPGFFESYNPFNYLTRIKKSHLRIIYPENVYFENEVLITIALQHQFTTTNMQRDSGSATFTVGFTSANIHPIDNDKCTFDMYQINTPQRCTLRFDISESGTQPLSIYFHQQGDVNNLPPMRTTVNGKTYTLNGTPGMVFFITNTRFIDVIYEIVKIHKVLYLTVMIIISLITLAIKKLRIYVSRPDKNSIEDEEEFSTERP